MNEYINYIYLGYILNSLSFVLFHLYFILILKKLKPNEILEFIKTIEQEFEEKTKSKYFPNIILYIIPFWGFYKLIIFILFNLFYLNNSSNSILYILKKTTQYTNIFSSKKNN